MRTDSQLFRRGAVYYFRRSIRWADGATYRISISLLTRRFAVARSYAPRLANRCETLRAQLEAGSTAPPLTFEQRRAIFRQQLLAERDRLEALHLDIIGQAPGATDPGDRLMQALADAEQCSRDLIRNGLPHGVAAGETAREAGQSAARPDHALWAAEAVAVLQANGLAVTEDRQRAMLKVLHEARVAGIGEFRLRFEDPGSAYAAGASAGARTGTRRRRAAVAPARAQGSDAAGSTWGPRHRTSSGRRSRAAPLVSAEWATLSVAAAAARYVARGPRAGRGATERVKRARRVWDKKTLRQFNTAVMLLGKVLPGPISTIQQDDLICLSDWFDRLPQSHHKSARHEAMSLEAIADEAAAQVTAKVMSADKIGLMPPTTNRHFRFLRQLCNWMRRKVPQMEELYWDDVLFTDDRNARELRDAFTLRQGRTLFELPIWTGCRSVNRRIVKGTMVYHDAAFWVPLIAWYTAARREEVCKLMVADVWERRRLSYLSIDATSAGRIKNTQSKRLIPIAQELKRLGFLEYVRAMRDAGETLLFPDLLPRTGSQTMGDVYYKRFWRPMRADLPFLKPGMGLHCFRHMVATKLKHALVFAETRSDLLGHTMASETTDRYSKATLLRQLARVVDKIPIATAHLEPLPLNVPWLGRVASSGSRTVEVVNGVTQPRSEHPNAGVLRPRPQRTIVDRRRPGRVVAPTRMAPAAKETRHRA